MHIFCMYCQIVSSITLVSCFTPSTSSSHTQTIDMTNDDETLPLNSLTSIGRYLTSGEAEHSGHVKISSPSSIWSLGSAAIAILLFIVAGFLEVGGGWCVWQTVREGRHWSYLVAGIISLSAYGFVPCLQPMDDFGRIYAVYGGFFIGLSFLWGFLVDGQKLDKGDFVGSIVAWVGVLIIMFWPR